MMAETKRKYTAPSAEQAAMVTATGIGDVRYLAVQQEMHGFRKAAATEGRTVGQKVRAAKSAAKAERAAAKADKAAGKPVSAAKRKAAAVVSKGGAVAAKGGAAVADRVRGVVHAPTGLDKFGRASAVSNPYMLALSGGLSASTAWNAMRESGGSKGQAAGAAAVAAAPAAATIAAPAMIAKALPKVAAVMSRAALPLTAITTGIGAIRGGMNAYKHGDSMAAIAGSTLLGAADALTFGLATQAVERATGVKTGLDPVTMAIAKAAGQVDASGNKVTQPSSGGSAASKPATGSQTGPQRLTAAEAKQFEAASGEHGGGKARAPAAEPKTSDRQPGFGPEARIAAYYRRHPDGKNPPYGGDPKKAANYTNPLDPQESMTP